MAVLLYVAPADFEKMISELGDTKAKLGKPHVELTPRNTCEYHCDVAVVINLLPVITDVLPVISILY
jgi:hypothetical protein